MLLGCKAELQPCIAGQLHFCPKQHFIRRAGAFYMPEVDDIARSWPNPLNPGLQFMPRPASSVRFRRNPETAQYL
jgi:hypothetical protein